MQLEAEALEVEARRATVEEVVATALAACGADAQRKGLRLETELNGAADAPCSPRVGRVLQNLVQNAIRHTPADGTVRVEAERGPGALRLTVSDSGEGIPADSLDRVFEPFWRGDPPQRRRLRSWACAVEADRGVARRGNRGRQRSDPGSGFARAAARAGLSLFAAPGVVDQDPPAAVRSSSQHIRALGGHLDLISLGIGAVQVPPIDHKGCIAGADDPLDLAGH